MGLLLGNGVRWLLMVTSLYTFSPIYTFAQTENDMVLVPSGKLIISTEHGTTEIFIDNFLWIVLKLLRSVMKELSVLIHLFLLIENGLLKK